MSFNFSDIACTGHSPDVGPCRAAPMGSACVQSGNRMDGPRSTALSSPSNIVALATVADVASGQHGGMGAITLMAMVLGIQVDAYFRDEESAFDGPMPGSALRRLISDARKQAIEGVIVSGLASLGDDMIEALANLHALRRCRVATYVAGIGPVTAADLAGLPLQAWTSRPRRGGWA